MFVMHMLLFDNNIVPERRRTLDPKIRPQRKGKSNAALYRFDHRFQR